MSNNEYKRKKNFKKEEIVFKGTEYEKVFIIPGRFQDRRRAEKEKNLYVQKIKKIIKLESSDKSSLSFQIVSEKQTSLLIPIKYDRKNIVYIEENMLALPKYSSLFSFDVDKITVYINFYKSQKDNPFFFDFTIYDYVVMINKGLLRTTAN